VDHVILLRMDPQTLDQFNPDEVDQVKMIPLFGKDLESRETSPMEFTPWFWNCLKVVQERLAKGSASV